MSIVAPDQKRMWVALSIVAFALLAVTALALLNLAGVGGSTSAPTREHQVGENAPAQAPWRIAVHVSGAGGEISRAERSIVARHRGPLREVVRQIYDAVLLHPNRLGETLRSHFTPAAGAALRRADIKARRPEAAATTARKARIGLDVNGARSAVASVVIRAGAEGAARPTVHRATLWLQRIEKSWKVVAFEVTQARSTLDGPGKPGGKRQASGARLKADGGRDRPGDGIKAGRRQGADQSKTGSARKKR